MKFREMFEEEVMGLEITPTMKKVVKKELSAQKLSNKEIDAILDKIAELLTKKNKALKESKLFTSNEITKEFVIENAVEILTILSSLNKGE